MGVCSPVCPPRPRPLALAVRPFIEIDGCAVPNAGACLCLALCRLWAGTDPRLSVLSSTSVESWHCASTSCTCRPPSIRTSLPPFQTYLMQFLLTGHLFRPTYWLGCRKRLPSPLVISRRPSSHPLPSWTLSLPALDISSSRSVFSFPEAVLDQRPHRLTINCAALLIETARLDGLDGPAV